jgi:hypothetical protein
MSVSLSLDGEPKKFGAEQDWREAVRQMLVSDRRFQFEEWSQPPWAHVWRSGLVADAETIEWRGPGQLVIQSRAAACCPAGNWRIPTETTRLTVPVLRFSVVPAPSAFSKT